MAVVYEVKRLRIAGVDPGETIGLALRRGDHTVGQHGWELFELKWPSDASRLRELLSTVDVVVCESFRLFPDVNLVGSRMVPAEVIGFLRAWSEEAGIPLEEQSASIKRVMTRAEMSRLLGFKLKGGKHALDAAAHVLFYMLYREPPSAKGGGDTAYDRSPICEFFCEDESYEFEPTG